MKRMNHLPTLLAVLTWSASTAMASTVNLQLNSFDVVNNANAPAYGFEIELDDVHSTDITYTSDNSYPYGRPKITEDSSDPAHPKVFIRYESAKDSYTGAFYYSTAVNGWEHFGFGYYTTPTIVKYHWLIEDPAAPGALVRGPAVNFTAPAWTYTPAQPELLSPAQVVAKIPAPPAQSTIPLAAFGDAVWVKAIKTTTQTIMSSRLII